MSERRFTDRESARRIFLRRLTEPRPRFSSYPYDLLVTFAREGLRWLDCAPEGANHLVGPLQDKRGVPMGGVYREDVGPNRAVREARAARGIHPFSGRREDGPGPQTPTPNRAKALEAYRRFGRASRLVWVP